MDAYVVALAQFAKVQGQLFVVGVVWGEYDVPAIPVDDWRPQSGYIDVSVDTVADSDKVSDQSYIEVFTFIQSSYIFTSTNEDRTLTHTVDVQ